MKKEDKLPSGRFYRSGGPQSETKGKRNHRKILGSC